MSLLFITCGLTHSGKTTFAKQLQAALGESAKFIRVDNDEIDEFIKEKYPNLRGDADILATKTPTNPDLRLLIPQLITGYALKENYSVIATALHPKLAIRQAYYDIAKQHNAKVVLLLFQVEEAELLKRVKRAGRNESILDISPHGGHTFAELVVKQKQRLEEPDDAEKQSCFKVFEVRPENSHSILEEAIKLANADYSPSES